MSVAIAVIIASVAPGSVHRNGCHSDEFRAHHADAIAGAQAWAPALVPAMDVAVRDGR